MGCDAEQDGDAATDATGSIAPGRCAGDDSTAARDGAPGAAVTLRRSAQGVLKYANETDAPLKAHTAANPFFGSVLG